MQRTIQWTGDNEQVIDDLLGREHMVRADKHADKLHVHGIGLDIMLELGDSLILDGDRLGVNRAPRANPLEQSFVTWTGSNMQEIVDFLAAYDVEIQVHGEGLYIKALNSPIVLGLGRGDRLVKRHGKIIVSIAGKDHRMH